MGHGFIDRSSRMDSHVHRLDARTKIIIALIFVVLEVSIPPQHLLAFVIYAGLLLWTLALSRIPVGLVLKRALMVLPFSALVALGLPFVRGGEMIVIGGIHLSLTGLWIFVGATIKSMLGAVALILLVSTTPFNRLLDGLRRLGIPTIFVDMIALTYRYLYILIDEATRLRRAAIARGYAPKWLPQAIIVGRLVGNLFVRSYERAERVYGAMHLRGYNGQIPTSACSPLSVHERLVLALMIIILITVRLLVQ
jgi:cobalt/nickel transport system permease protein